jgi:CHAT domain-containing protein/tetratricopeptide (TPR) repeat protein
MTGWALPAVAETPSCRVALGAPTRVIGPLTTAGTLPVAADLALTASHSYLVEAEESGNDALLEVVEQGRVIALADHPERRTGTRRAVFTAAQGASLQVRATGKEDAPVTGTVTARVYDLEVLAARPDCINIEKTLAAADADYARGTQIARGHASDPTQNAHAAFARAAAGYVSALQYMTAADQTLRGETLLAVTGIQYYDLQDWAAAVDSAKTAAQSLAQDPYRHALADALSAAASIEIASSSAVQTGTPAAQLNERVRQKLRSLNREFLALGKPYDAAMQVNNIGRTYYHEGRYAECAQASTAAARTFESVPDPLRRAIALQNAALCLWGLGRLAEAERIYERTLPDIAIGVSARIYLAAVTNAALLDYALGRFDESLRLYDRALSLAQKVQAQRDEAYCLYGIGVDYYALGDRTRAREFLERSLAIRTVALDGRGRMDSLRVLAALDAEQGDLVGAQAADREALQLAIAPAAIQRITILLAGLTASAGHPEEGRAQLDELLARQGIDPLIRAEALLQRAVVLRQMGQPQLALKDLTAARPRLHALGSLAQEFDANLQLARTLRLLGQMPAALAAADRAVDEADAVRLQTANPELRSQLQTPLRAAYELKIELLRGGFEAAEAASRPAEATRLAALAFSTADVSRARTLADLGAQRYPPEVRRALSGELRRRDGLYRELAARRFLLESRLARSGSDDPRARHLRSEIFELERQADTLNTLIATRAAPAIASGRRAVPGLPPIPSGTALVSYWLGSESAYAWVVQSQGIHWLRLSSPASIAAQVGNLHSSLERLVDLPREHRLADGATLAGMIVTPLMPWLVTARQWIVVPDGALAYVPFAALPVSPAAPTSFAVIDHDIALTPAAWMLDAPALRQSDKRRDLLLVADPVYQPDDPRLKGLPLVAPSPPAQGEGVTDAARDYQRLPYTAREAANIAAEFPNAGVDELTGLNATRARLLAVDWSGYRFIHIATHGLVDAQEPQLSALILGSYDAAGHHVDGAVRVADLSLQTLDADVAVFSACDTALGKEVPSEGLMGIDSTVLARGARAVVGSLWPVADEIGAQLMTDFYRHLVRDSMSAPAALAAAMRTVLKRDASTDPALWAAFQVSVITLGPGLPQRDARIADIATTNRP